MWAIVSARSPTAWYDSSNSHSGRPARSRANSVRRRVGTDWRGLPPLREYDAHAATSGSAAEKYAISASSFSFVAVVPSRAVYSAAKRFIASRPRAKEGIQEGIRWLAARTGLRGRFPPRRLLD